MIEIEYQRKNSYLMKQATPNQRLRLVRELLHFNQTQFSKALGFKQSHISAIESEKKEVSVKIIYALVNKFKVSANWLLSGEGEMFLTLHDKVEYTAEPEENAGSAIATNATVDTEALVTLSAPELTTRIKELETAVFEEAYLPLYRLCELYAVTLNVPADFSVLNNIHFPDLNTISSGSLSPVFEAAFGLNLPEDQEQYCLELEKLYLSWKTDFNRLFNQFYFYTTQPEKYQEELKVIRQAPPQPEAEV